jgi:cytochrome c
MKRSIKELASVLLVAAVLVVGTFFGASEVWAQEKGAGLAQGPSSEQAKRIEAMVNNAAALAESRGKAAFSEFRKPDSEWWFGSTYLFAYDQNLNVLLNPAFPKREGTNPRGQKDANGKAFHDEFLMVVQTKGSGWVDYMFPKPGQTQLSQKWSYVKAVNIDGTPAIIGAGFYPE